MRTLVWAHRGASAYAPENTLPAFEKAAEMQADGVELDVQLTSDGELVVTHDESIERVSDGTGYVKDHTFAELRKMNFNRVHPEYTKVQIPTLEEVYELLKPTGLTINVEFKTGVFRYSGIEEKVLDLTARMGMEEKVMYSSFNHETLVHLRNLKSDVNTGLLYSDGWLDVAPYAKEKAKVNALHPGQADSSRNPEWQAPSASQGEPLQGEVHDTPQGGQGVGSWKSGPAGPEAALSEGNGLPGEETEPVRFRFLHGFL